jgi:hypothetical protein
VDEKPLMEEALKNLDLSFQKPCLAIASRNATETQNGYHIAQGEHGLLNSLAYFWHITEFFVISTPPPDGLVIVAEVELMKERFAKLLLGDDMSGGAKGVCTALAISNAITNLSGISSLNGITAIQI